MNAHTPARRKPTNISLDERLVAEAKEARKHEWVTENWEAIESSNIYAETHGLPLAKYRQL
jgi:post-segregation antitoxin (ccd killing protein)